MRHGAQGLPGHLTGGKKKGTGQINHRGVPIDVWAWTGDQDLRGSWSQLPNVPFPLPAASKPLIWHRLHLIALRTSAGPPVF